MFDFNHRSPNGRMNVLLDEAIEKHRSEQKPRDYLGGSRLGVECERALQFEFFNTPKDPGKDFSGRVLRIFEFGHVLEDMMIGWLSQAGFDLKTRDRNGDQFEFSVLDGAIKGHLDGVLVSGPDVMAYPALWENKSMKADQWKKTVKDGVAKAHPEYAAQIAIYQAYMDLTENPALFSTVNKDTSEIRFELVPFDSALAQRCSDKGVRIIQACQAGDLLPRIAQSPDFFKCKWCSWSDRCWSQSK
jgi:hypothetical protein